MAETSSAVRLTSSLNDVANDTGRIAFCGPYVLSAITGYPISRVEAEIHELRATREHSNALIKGTYANEVEATLGVFGFKMELKQDYMHVERKARPTVWQWMQKPRNAWAHYILAIHKGKEGHWILIKGVKMCDTYSAGKWQFVCDGPHRGARIMEIFEVRRKLEF
jgi:hypothetical protein